MANEDYQWLSSLEKKVYRWLVEHEIPFRTQVKMFGYSGELGSATVDFILDDRNLGKGVLRVDDFQYFELLSVHVRHIWPEIDQLN